MKENKNTTFAGIGALLATAATVVTALGNGESINWLSIIPGVLAAIGLIFARDAKNTN